MFDFMFATGVEGSAPTIDGGRTRVDEFEKCGHYRRWREDFDCVQQLGVRVLRYGPPLHRTYRGPGRFDWSFADETFGDLQRRGILPIADLCHFGVPDWIGDFQNPDFPELFAAYARAFARRFPWVQFYTPVNEMMICATFSAKYGWWNEQLSSDRDFVTALKHIVKANVLAMRAILEVRPDPVFVQSESSQRFHPRTPDAIPTANFLNAWRFLSLDLNYGKSVEAPIYEYLLDCGMTREEYAFFQTDDMRHHCIIGNDYYPDNELWVNGGGQVRPAGEIFGYDEITRQYHERYHLPVMHTETNFPEGPTRDEAVSWLWKQWANVLHVRRYNIPIVGFTWYSLIDQVDWDTALREPRGRANPLGLFDLDRKIRPVGEAYKALIETWRDAMFTRSESLTLLLRSEHDERERARAVNAHTGPAMVV